MRTLGDIIDAAKDGSPTTHEELLYALLAYSALHYFDYHALQQLHAEPSRFRTPESEYTEAFRRFKIALGKSPKDYVGWNNDPANPAYRERIALGRRIVDKLAARATEPQA